MPSQSLRVNRKDYMGPSVLDKLLLINLKDTLSSLKERYAVQKKIFFLTFQVHLQIQRKVDVRAFISAFSGITWVPGLLKSN